MEVESGPVSEKSVSGENEIVEGPQKEANSEGVESPQKKEANSEGNVSPSPPAKEKKSLGIRIVGSRIYDPVNGKSCHQCRQKTRDFMAACKNQRNNKPCPILYCRKCLLNRYGEKAEEVAALGEWSCPKCRGICNCSVCMKKRGHEPTGILINTAKATGFSSVSEMLLNGGELLNRGKIVADVVPSPKKDLSPMKREKENSYGGKELNLPNHVDKKSKKVEEVCIGSKVDNDANLAGRTSPGKLEASNEILKQAAKLNIGVDPGENAMNVTKKGFVQPVENNKTKEDSSNSSDKNHLKCQDEDLNVDIVLPVGVELTSVAGIDVCTEDVGSALQFLEFCTVFGEILEVKKGEPEHILQDILHGRTERQGNFSLTVQFHIHLLSILQPEQEEYATSSPSCGKDSWFHGLKECFSESPGLLKAQGLDALEKAADYEALTASEKLRLLNLLCDEVLGTEKVRNWMDDQNTKLAEKVKEAKQENTAAKAEEKILKKKMKDDVAKAVIAKHGAPLSLSEHEAIVSQIKRDVAEAHAKVLESKDIISKNNQTADAVRVEPIIVGRDGDACWKLNCLGKSDVLCQKAGRGDTLTIPEKWFTVDDEGKEVIEKHINSLRKKRQRRRRAPRIAEMN